MKQLIFLLLFVCPLVTFSQKVINLDIQQAPEFGFSVSSQDTTIVKGESVILGEDLDVFGGSGFYQYSWSPSASLSDSTQSRPIATPNDTTVYLLTVTDSEGCSFSLQYTVNVRESMVNIEEAELVENLRASLYPNPNSGRFKIHISGPPSDKLEISIYDVSGKILLRKIVPDFLGDITETLQLVPASGIFSFKVVSGSETLSRQFIIQ